MGYFSACLGFLVILLGSRAILHSNFLGLGDSTQSSREGKLVGGEGPAFGSLVTRVQWAAARHMFSGGRVDSEACKEHIPTLAVLYVSS